MSPASVGAFSICTINTNSLFYGYIINYEVNAFKSIKKVTWALGGNVDAYDNNAIGSLTKFKNWPQRVKFFVALVGLRTYL